MCKLLVSKIIFSSDAEVVLGKAITSLIFSVFVNSITNLSNPIANPPEPILSLGINLNLMISQYRAGIES